MDPAQLSTLLTTWLLISPASFHFTADSLTLFQLPTENPSLIDGSDPSLYFVGTPGRTWESGRFGCVRSEGRQIHEGIDIRCVRRGPTGEPVDPIRATTDGRVAYVNTQPGLSSYGNYVVLVHDFQGLELYSLYAHLQETAQDLKPGKAIGRGDLLGVMGRTANTQSRISKERAHLHFEIGFLLNGRFKDWHKEQYGENANQHGNFHGYNLAGLDPEKLLSDQAKGGIHFNPIQWIRSQPILFRVLIPDPYLDWPRRNPALVKRNPKAEKEGLFGFEIGFTFNGTPVEAMPRAPLEWPNQTRSAFLTDVVLSEFEANPCRDLVQKEAGRWRLTKEGQRLVTILSYPD